MLSFRDLSAGRRAKYPVPRPIWKGTYTVTGPPMNRVLPPIVFTFVVMFLLFSSPSASAATGVGGACPSGVTVGVTSCFFIAANGLDSNSGTSESSPWLHAPGMSSCSASCAAVTPSAGQGFIFRGGDTWHFGASTAPATGGEWQWTWSGSSTSCNYPTSTSSCIYIGVDPAWHIGSSWARPIMNLDNPTIANTTNPDTSHVGFVLSCPHEDHNFIALYVNASYVQVDNFEFTGKCWTQIPTFGSDSEVKRNGSYITLTNSYFHGWTESYNPQASGGANVMDQGIIINGGNPGATHNVAAYDVFDGSDSTCTGVGNCTGGPAFYGDAYDVHNSIFRYMGNALNSPSNMTAIHDNLFENLYESYDPNAHGGVMESYGNNMPSGASMSIYNNIIRNTDIGVTINPGPPSGGTLYVFNNVWWNNTNSANCLAFENNSSAAVKFYITNNTFDAPCNTRFLVSGGPNPVNGTATFQNNHYIGYQSATCAGTCGTPLTLTYSIDGGTTVTVVNNGSHVFQSESVANGQGYTQSNDYAPTSSGGATVGAGANLTPNCPAYSAGSMLCSGTSGAVTEGTSSTALFPAIPIVTRASNSPPNWDAGAYFFGSSVNAPTGLTATVQ